MMMNFGGEKLFSFDGYYLIVCETDDKMNFSIIDRKKFLLYENYYTIEQISIVTEDLFKGGDLKNKFIQLLSDCFNIENKFVTYEYQVLDGKISLNIKLSFYLIDRTFTLTFLQRTLNPFTERILLVLDKRNLEQEDLEATVQKKLEEENLRLSTQAKDLSEEFSKMSVYVKNLDEEIHILQNILKDREVKILEIEDRIKEKDAKIKKLNRIPIKYTAYTNNMISWNNTNHTPDMSNVLKLVDGSIPNILSWDDRSSGWLQFDFKKPMLMVKSKIGSGCGDWDIEYSDDGSEFVKCVSINISNSKEYAWDASVGAHRYWRYYMRRNTGQPWYYGYEWYYYEE